MEEQSPHRLKYTALHEAGHWFIHPEYYAVQGPAQGQVSMFAAEKRPGKKACRASDMENKRKSFTTTEEFIEHQANTFASAVAIPRKALFKLFPELCQKFLGALGKTTYKGLAANEKEYVRKCVDKEVASIFDVSLQVAKYRIEKLGLWRIQDGTLLDGLL